ncbi:MAG: hypothetical protein EZS28_018326 [Streblomastix strix]|uniref:Uncharacterized protein n=1 Tax=Streblomastix strix TaxID=222440 RepID=A0A5J4VU91_9EUKA|nr:MAG: hypothetical protein EZS28_018326 [Streblomastix strix]
MADNLTDMLNFILYKYFLENGFEHTAFSFANESKVLETGVGNQYVPPGQLVRLVQKGVMYTELEERLKKELANQSQDPSQKDQTRPSSQLLGSSQPINTTQN